MSTLGQSDYCSLFLQFNPHFGFKPSVKPKWILLNNLWVLGAVFQVRINALISFFRKRPLSFSDAFYAHAYVGLMVPMEILCEVSCSNKGVTTEGPNEHYLWNLKSNEERTCLLTLGSLDRNKE